MQIGVLKERKVGERRVILLPGAVRHLVDDGNEVLVEYEAGLGAGAPDVRYAESGARIVERSTVNCRVSAYLNTESFLENALEGASLVIGAALARGARAPRILRRDHLPLLAEGAVFVDVAIDQGGCAETSRPTTLEIPTYVVDRVIHRCVTNMPGSVPETASSASSAAVLPYIQSVAARSGSALASDPALRTGINIWQGELVQPDVAAAHSLPLSSINDGSRGRTDN